ncbi:hypothetical protein [Secundilactobacillus kimchicus]|uniref:Uncharacterized protein n=1 Tax=Secundilactobacillus kimchicus JCM 15530 TaxID=1302272 RepID=A0A0R1HQD4_9LACO|nr:hypothetical protein [Secundilactobacillus kimchicus]KRK49029.1 hypothetical protein FC96_GL001357 [Secundilactobacillus kimchicus JCM 15530]MBT9671769.1 hypothetical protein [Secundilactobacillus kimchicus]
MSKRVSDGFNEVYEKYESEPKSKIASLKDVLMLTISLYRDAKSKCDIKTAAKMIDEYQSDLENYDLWKYIDESELKAVLEK